MGLVESLGIWIAANESLLSGIAALVAVAGVVISPIIVITNRMRRERAAGNAALNTSDATSQDTTSAASHKVTYRDLVKPSPYPIQFAGEDGARIAYQQFGTGNPPIVMTPGIVSHLHVCANLPSFHDSLEAVASAGRVTFFDKRGQGLSDPCADMPSVEDRAQDIRSVMDAANLESAVLVGISEGGPIAIQFAHDYPQRVRALVLIGTTARFMRGDDFPIGIPEEQLDAIQKYWGKGVLRDVFFPSLSRDVVDDDCYRAMEKLLAPKDAIAQTVALLKRIDVRKILPDLQVPTLVIHFTGDLSVPIRLGRYVADNIPNATFLEVEGSDHADISGSARAIEGVRDFCAKFA